MQPDKMYKMLSNATDQGLCLMELVYDDAGKVVDLIFREQNVMFGKHTGMGNVVGKKVSDLLPRFEANWIDIYSKVAKTGETMQAEEYVRDVGRWYHTKFSLAGEIGSKWVAVALEDVTGLKLQEQALKEAIDAKNALHESEAKYRTLFENIDEGFCVIELILNEAGDGITDIRYREVNQSFARQAGLKGNVTGELTSKILPRLTKDWVEILLRVYQTGEPMRVEKPLEHTGRWYDLHIARIDGPGSLFLTVVFHDITEQKQHEEYQAFLLTFTDALRHEPNATAVAHRALELLIAQLQLDRSYITTYYLDQDRADMNYQRGNDTVPELPSHFKLSDFPEALKATFEGTLVIEDDWERQGLTKTEKRNSRQLGMRALIAATLHKEHHPLWSMVAISSRPRRWTPADIKLVEEVAERTWAALERVKAEEVIRRSEEKYRSIFENIDEGFSIQELIVDENGNVTDLIYREVNRAYAKHSGIVNAQGKKASELFPWLEPHWLNSMTQLYKTGQPLRTEGYQTDVKRWFTLQYASLGGAGSRIISVVFQDITEQKIREANLTFLNDVSTELEHLTSIRETLEVLGAKLGQHFGLSHCRFVELGEDNDTIIVNHGWQREGMPVIKNPNRVSDFLTAEFSRKMHAGETVVINDVWSDPLADGDKFLSVDIGSLVTVPLQRNGELRFWLGLYHSEAHEWQDEEVTFINELTARIWMRLERARTEEALQQSEEKYRRLFDTMEEGFTILGVVRSSDGQVIDFRYLEINRAQELETGLERQNILRRKLSEVLPGEEADRWIRIYKGVIDSGAPEVFEEYSDHLDRWYLVSAYPRKGDEMSVFSRDITERKRHEQRQSFLSEITKELAELQNINETIERLAERIAKQFKSAWCNFAELSDNLDLGIVINGWNSDRVTPLKGTYKITDIWTEDQISKNNAGETTVVNDTQNDSRVNARAYAGLGIMSFLVVPFASNGVFKFMIGVIDTKPRKWRDDEIELAKEISTRVWARLEKAAVERALRQRERELVRVQEIGNIGGVDVDIENKLIGRRSPEYLRLHGLTAESKFESHEDWLGRLHPDDRERAEKTLFNALQGDGLIYESEYRIIRPDNGELRWIYARLDIERNAAGKPSRLIGVHIDITPRKLAEEALRASEVKQEFLLKLSDTLRPLSDPAEIQYETVRLLRAHLNTSRAIYAEAVDQHGKMRISAESAEPDLVPIKEMITHFGDFMPDALAEAMQGRPVWREDVLRDEHQPERQAGYAALKTRSWIMLPLVKDGRLLAQLTVHHSEPRAWNAREIDLMREAAERTWAAVERAKVEAALRDSEKRLRLTTEAADMATWEWDLVKNQVFWNERHFRIFGLEPQNEPVDPSMFFNHVHPSERNRVEKLLRQSLEDNVEFDTEFCALREDGTERWMSGYGRVMERKGGEPVLMNGVMFDITARRQAEKALRHVEERQKAILESATEYAIITLDLDLRVQDWNAGAENMLGYTEQEIIGQPGEIFFVPEDRAIGAPQHEKHKAVTEGRAENERWHLRKDSSRFYGSGVTTPLMDDAGEVIGLLKVMRDLTSEKRAEDALKQADKRKDEFLAMLAHELRNPISTVQNGLSILKITRQTDSDMADIVGMMDKQATHLVRMIDDLLDVSRVTQGKIELKTDRLELATLVSNAVKAIQPQFESRQKHVHVTALHSNLFVQGDSTRLSQVVTNLLTNSLRYTGGDGQVWVSLSTKNNEAIIRIKDNGIGLTAEQQTSVFELFVQGDNSLARTQGGLGIGLTLVKQLVEMHHGRVTAQSPGIGEGSEFSVYLPLLELGEQKNTAEDENVSDAPSPQRVLIIDDLEDLAKLTSMLLRLKGYKVDISLNGRSGAELVETMKPAIILCDIGMPELDGYETARLIRQGAWGQKAILIALSGYGQKEDKRLALEAGFDGHLTKPIELNELENLITSLRQTGQRG